MKEDLRTIRTKESIKFAFVSLLKEKSYNSISVSEIASRARINRNTFYLHYESKDDLIEHLLQNVIIKQESQLNEFATRLIMDPEHVRSIYLFVIFKALLNLLASEADFYKTLLKDDALSGYIGKIGFLIKKAVFNFFHIDNYHDEVLAEYTFSGFWGTIKYWLCSNDCESTINDTANVLSKIFYRSLKFKKDNKK